MQEQKKFRYVYNGKEVDRKQFEELTSGSFKWFECDSIVSVPFSSFDNFFNGEFKSGRQINDHLDSVLNVYQNKVTEDIINKPKCSPQCYCNGSCKKPQEKKLGGYDKPTIKGSSTRHKSQAGETHAENKVFFIPPNFTGWFFDNEDRPDIKSFDTIKDAENYFHKSKNTIGRIFKDKEIVKELKKEDKDDVITSSNRGEKETLQGLKYNNLKPSLDIVINRQFPKALQLIALATEYGHKKYIENDSNYLNYKYVKGGSQTYFDASARHSTDRNGLDESGLPHIIHAVWSSLAGLELWAEENNINVKEFTEKFMKNLHNSK